MSNLQTNNNFTLPDSGMLLMPFSVEAAVASLPVFCASPGMAGILDNLLEFLIQDGYQLTIRSCPTTQQQGGSNLILANQMFEDQLSIPAGSFLLMVGGISLTAEAGKYSVYSNNFRVRLYDAGAQQSCSDGFMHSNCITGNFTRLPQTGQGMLTTLTGNKNLFILPSPLAISSPGQLNVQIVNLEAVTAQIDMAFFFAVPVGHHMPIEAAKVFNTVGR